ncbi:MAG: 16S rRNA (guanine(527)-N(7))-methyltransferase RsmG, partial [Methylophilaceae bacterium]|nr:16S rRNA (guanine(527)-N(7))-methyltransferase RsmG [Methylophilaceae bacterium]
WNPAINLVSRNSLKDGWSRHILDSAQIFQLAPQKCQHWVDLGSGAGFPGLVVAIMAKDMLPHLKVTLVEADQRKAAFLREAARTLELTIGLEVDRVENLPSLRADLLSARALAPLERLLGMAARHILPSATCLFLKGASYESETSEARRTWKFDLEAIKSITDGDGVILKIEGLTHG